MAAIEAGTGIIAQDKSWQKDHPKFVIHCLELLIRRSKKLQTLNLSNCGLNKQVLVGLVRSLRHAKALLCIHLDCNPGIDDEVLRYFTSRLRCKEEEVPLRVEVQPKRLFNANEAEKRTMNQLTVWSKMHVENQNRIEEVCQYINN